MKPISPNTMIQNRYLVVHQIGKGGMGEVYLAVDQRLGSAVAIKRMTLIGDDVMAAAFEREAKVLGRLRHPVLPKVIDHFVDANGQFLVMEHISGDDLAKRLETAGKPFPLSWVMFWSDQLLDGLNYLHSHEPPIIHRDIKPQNLKLTDENHIVLLDFGLSKDFDTGKGDSPVNSASVSGYSPAFAPMEQIRGSGTNARSDIYSFAASFYQLLANAIPTDALARADAMLGGAGDPVIPLHVANPQVPEGVSAVFMKALSVRQDERYATAAEMQRELRRAFNASGQQTGAETLVMPGGTSGQAAVKPSTSTQGSEIVETPTLVMGGGQSATETDPGTGGDHVSADLGATIVMEENVLTEHAQQSNIETQVLPVVQAPVTPQQVPPTADEPPAVDLQKTVPTSPHSAERAEASRVVVDTELERPMAAAAGLKSSIPQPVSASTPKKGSGGKLVVMILAGIAGVIVVLGGAAGGLYYYTQNSAAVPEPASTPAVAANTASQPTPEPTAEPQQQAAEPEAANTDPSNSNTVAEDRKTAANKPAGATPRPTTTQQRDVAGREQKPAAPKATPKPKSGDDRTVIMQ
ncbi:MAG: protein kinase [Acidobacteria bacterium]|nr:protein kinase [Acidobacteriota bacterium]